MEHGMGIGTQSSLTGNIVLNHDFSRELLSWHSNCCDAYVVAESHKKPDQIAANSGLFYAVATKRTESWQGLEQDITERISPGCTYLVSAYVRVWGCIEGSTSVQATLRLEKDTTIEYLFVGRTEGSKEKWHQLEGEFFLSSKPKRVVLYFEGPPPGVDLLIDSVLALPSSHTQFEARPTPNGEENITKDPNVDDGLKNLSVEVKAKSASNTEENIIRNPRFEDGLRHWSGRGCKLILHDCMGDGKILPYRGKVFASTKERRQSWNGIEQEITGRVQRKLAYETTCVVRIFGTVDNADVEATLWVQSPNGREEYICIAKVQASDKEWVHLHGKFLINGSPSRVVIYLEGPPPGTDILAASFDVKRAEKLPRLPPPNFETHERIAVGSGRLTNIISNPGFSEGLHFWQPNSCNGCVVSGARASSEGVTARSGESFAVISDRTESWQGLEQDITDRVSITSSYTVSAWVRVSGGQHETCEVLGTIRLESPHTTASYMLTGRVLASERRWVELKGSFSLSDMPKRVVFFLEGPPPGVDLLIDSVSIVSSHLDVQKRVLFGENIIKNSSLTEELTNWHPMGACTLKLCSGSPVTLPSLAKQSLGHHLLLSGRYILATSRSESWMGPAQTITDRLRLHLTYQISAWVRVGAGTGGPQNINVALNVGHRWVNGGQIEVNDGQWYEVSGSFRLEEGVAEVTVYVQGPSPGVDLMVSGLHIFPVDRIGRFEYLKKQTDKVRKRDVVLRFHGPHHRHQPVRVRQTKNSFPFGACISRSILDNEDFVDFFLKNFTWAVFANELKWAHTEPQRGAHNYADADEMLVFCERHGIQVRAHCLFWECEETLPTWVRSLNRSDLVAAIQARAASVLTRYRGRFRHWDVNNEMLHGSLRERLGADLWVHMFQLVHRADPTAALFVNDYHVEDGRDPKSTPEKYARHVLDLQDGGAAVGGVGIQAHVDRPVGPMIAAALDRLAALGLPIWLTEVDVSAADEHVRAEDLEVVLREAYAHPTVGGVMLWGFWETATWREHSHLVDAEGGVNAAGERFLALRREWLTEAEGAIDGAGEFRFRGFHGTYDVEVAAAASGGSQCWSTLVTIVVEEGESTLVIDVHP